MKNIKVLPLILSILSIAFSIAMFVSAFKEYKEQKEYGHDAIEVVATVTRIEEGSYDIELGQRYEIYINYEYDGENYDKLYNSNARRNAYDVGDKISLRIHPDAPANTISSIGSVIGLAFTGFIGIGFFVLFVYFSTGKNVFTFFKKSKKNAY